MFVRHGGTGQRLSRVESTPASVSSSVTTGLVLPEGVRTRGSRPGVARVVPGVGVDGRPGGPRHVDSVEGRSPCSPRRRDGTASLRGGRSEDSSGETRGPSNSGPPDRLPLRRGVGETPRCRSVTHDFLFSIPPEVVASFTHDWGPCVGVRCPVRTLGPLQSRARVEVPSRYDRRC